MSRKRTDRLTEEEFRHLVEEVDDSATAAASAYGPEIRAALHELGQLRGRCLCRGAFRCTPCLEEMEVEAFESASATDDDIHEVRRKALALATLCDIALSSREHPVGAAVSRTVARAAIECHLAEERGIR